MGKRRKKNNSSLASGLILLLVPVAFFGSLFGEEDKAPAEKDFESTYEEVSTSDKQDTASNVALIPIETTAVTESVKIVEETPTEINESEPISSTPASQILDIKDVLSYSGPDSVVINGNLSTFSDSELAFEGQGWIEYGDLDNLNRVTTMNAVVTIDMYDTGTEASSTILPTGWDKQNQDSGNPKQLNRGHLLGNVLGGSGEDLRNLMTLYRNANYPEMYFGAEEIVKEAIESGSTVRYRVTPLFEGDDLMAKGVHMMAKSIGDDSVDLNIFVYNQPKDEMN